MSEYVDNKALRKLLFGRMCPRAAANHINATTPYFTVSGGRILVTGLVGLITIASGANACSWTSTPTIGTASVICAALDINPALVGDSLTITGLAADAMIYGGAGGLGMMARRIVVNVGTIDFIAAAADGASSWVLFYVPLDDGGLVRAA